jgi:hypothetical protein
MEFLKKELKKFLFLKKKEIEEKNYKKVFF